MSVYDYGYRDRYGCLCVIIYIGICMDVCVSMGMGMYGCVCEYGYGDMYGCVCEYRYEDMYGCVSEYQYRYGIYYIYIYIIMVCLNEKWVELIII